MIACDEPYIGDESIMRPPSAKKARTTSVQASRAARSSPTLKVIQLPRPTTGNASPLAGIVRVAIAGPGAARAVAGQALATMALRSQRRRVNSGVRSSK